MTPQNTLWRQPFRLVRPEARLKTATGDLPGIDPPVLLIPSESRAGVRHPCSQICPVA